MAKRVFFSSLLLKTFLEGPLHFFFFFQMYVGNRFFGTLNRGMRNGVSWILRNLISKRELEIVKCEG